MGCHASRILTQRLGAVLFLAAATGFSAGAPGDTTTSLLICDEDNGVESAHLETPYFAEDGSSRRLLVVDGSPEVPAGCDRKVLYGVSASDVRWAGPAEPDVERETPRSLILQGQFNETEATVSEVISNVPLASPSRSFLPFNQSVLGYFEPQSFGVDERVQMDAGDTLRCEAGERVAGVFFRSERRWLASAPMTLSLKAQGKGQFEIAIGDSRRDDEEAPLTLGSLTLDDDKSQSFEFEVPGNDRLWSSLTLICPTEAAELRIEDVRMEPLKRENDRPRGAWFWSPTFWQEQPERLWEAAQEQGLNELYVSVPVTDGEVADAEALAAFIENARDRDLDVWVVIGDPRDVLEQSWPAMRDRLQAFRRFNEEASSDARLAGVQLDIEPYLLPGFAQNHDYWRERYVKTIDEAQSVIDGALPLDLVVPSWWGIHPRWGEQLFDALDWRGARMTVMNYHTDPQRLQHDAEPFLSWAENHGKQIRLALEAGSLADETQLRFHRTDEDASRLWLVSVEQSPVLLLLNESRKDLPGDGFSYTGSTTVAASRYTFDGDLDRLAVVAAALEPEWSRWSAFDGLSVHGLDEWLDSGNKR